MFTAAETEACLHLLELALAEDLNAAGDLTSQALIPDRQHGRAIFVARSRGVLAGLPAVALVLNKVDPGLHFSARMQDGTAVEMGQRIAEVHGPMRSILTAERTALNFLQRLSGVATLTRKFVEAIAGLPSAILDTRKTTPGWRLLEKYAVRCGGAQNHRLGLYDGILIKDNHLAALGGDIVQAVAKARAYLKKPLPIEIEVDTIKQLEQALPCRPDIVLLDNMHPVRLREAVRIRDAIAPDVLLEASGGVNLATVREIAEMGVDRISSGALTHSAAALDIALDYQN